MKATGAIRGIKVSSSRQGRQGHIISAIQAGAAGYIVKPFSHEHIRAELSALLPQVARSSEQNPNTSPDNRNEAASEITTAETTPLVTYPFGVRFSRTTPNGATTPAVFPVPNRHFSKIIISREISMQ